MNSKKTHLLQTSVFALLAAAAVFSLFLIVESAVRFHSKLLCLLVLVDFLLFFALIGIIAHFYRKYKTARQAAFVEESLFGSPEGAVEVAAKYKGLLSIIENIESNEPFRKILSFIYTNFSPYIPYSHIGVALIDSGGRTIRASYAVSSPTHAGLRKRLLGYETELSATSLRQVLANGTPRVINDLEAYLKGRKIRKYNQILLEEGIRSSITFPLVKNGVPIGIIFFSSSQKNVYRSEHVEFLRTLANSIMLSLERNLLLDDLVVSSTLALATLTEERDNVTGDHLQRMKRYSVLLAKLMMHESCFSNRIDNDFVKSIERFAPLHDIGKVAISDAILLKPGKLTKEEFETMKTHTTYGGSVLRLADKNAMLHGRSIFRMGVEITEGHHEWWDGSGYPYGRKGENIPLSARIVAVADVLDALTSKRPYKEPFDFEVSANIVIRGAGTHFDPQIVEVFVKNLREFREEYDYFQNVSLPLAASH